MKRLKSWWQWWKESEAETDLRMGRDERYRRIEGDAYRIATWTIPIIILLALAAGVLWLPETIDKTTILQLALLAAIVVMSIFWLTVKIIMERRGTGWINPAMSPRRALVLFGTMALGFVSFILLLHWLLRTPTS